jgi:hypothetical protein
MILTWFAPFLEVQFPILNNFETFFQKFGVFFMIQTKNIQQQVSYEFFVND